MGRDIWVLLCWQQLSGKIVDQDKGEQRKKGCGSDFTVDD